MPTPRRRLVRSTTIADPTPAYQQRRLQAIRLRIDRERTALARWQSRLKRAFNAVQKVQRTIARLERQLANLGG